MFAPFIGSLSVSQEVPKSWPLIDLEVSFEKVVHPESNLRQFWRFFCLIVSFGFYLKLTSEFYKVS